MFGVFLYSALKVRAMLRRPSMPAPPGVGWRVAVCGAHERTVGDSQRDVPARHWAQSTPSDGGGGARLRRSFAEIRCRTTILVWQDPGLPAVRANFAQRCSMIADLTLDENPCM